jgi:hypothetical protein
VKITCKVAKRVYYGSMAKGDKNGALSVKMDRQDYQRLVTSAKKFERSIAQQLRIVVRAFYTGETA